MNNKKLITGIILLVVALLIFIFLTQPAWQKLKISRAELNRQTSQLKSLRELSQVLKQLEVEVGGGETQIERINIALPSEPQQPELLVQIATLASQNGLTLRQTAFGATGTDRAQSAGLKTLPISLSVSGSYTALKSFLAAIERNLRLIDVESLVFGSPKEGVVLDITINLKAYFRSS